MDTSSSTRHVLQIANNLQFTPKREALGLGAIQSCSNGVRQKLRFSDP